MKKHLIIFIPILMLTACNQEIIEPKNEVITPTTTKKVYVDNNPITVGLYQNGKLVTTYNATFRVHKDIGSFDVYYTNEPNVGSTNTKYNFNKYYNQYENIDKYKIGFYINFEVGDKLIEKTILDPSAKHSMDPYLYNYLYDDVHQKDGAWYSHLEPNDMKENTVFSSIKLYNPDKGPDITSDITLMVFTYASDEDFDEYGYYRGKSKYTITIKNNNK